ncbi:two-component regulator propeller domain-containing protein [Pedobacter frigiditerrae]|uniref:hybrid sensor histidine kinase/response regulator transcription factor n=1 Tax=Pedobacter frigiditerrae TaxID=2530452 RepID=UPI002931AE40|nr:two-component regulator propeller domain-containing protein [Pedobacter frigiditerrae]
MQMLSIKSIKYLFAILLVFGLGLIGYAQNRLVFNHLVVENGLSPNSVLSIVKDSQGFMWFGTKYGLNRYDGREIKVFKNSPQHKNSIASNDFVKALTLDNDKVLWVGSLWGLDKFNPESESFTHSVTGVDRANCIYKDREGVLWLGSNNGLTYSTDKNNKVFRAFNLGLKVPYQVQAIFQDHINRIWVGTTVGLVRLTKVKGRYHILFFNHSKDVNSISGNFITTVTEDQKKRLWVGTKYDGISLYEENKNSFKRFLHSDNSSNSLVNDHVRKILVDRWGKLWIGTQEGLSIINPETEKFENYVHDSADPSSLSQNSIHDIYEDNCGSVWIGTYFGGLDVVHTIVTPFEVYQDNKYKSSISSNIISTIVEDGKHNLWIGTEAGGLNYFNRETNTFKAYKNTLKDGASLSSNLVKSILIDKSQRVWIGTALGGINLFRPEKNDFVHYRSREFDKNSLSSDEVNCVFEDSEGKFWVGTQLGLDRFYPETGLFKPVNLKSISNTDKQVAIVFEDSKHNIWLGTRHSIKFRPKGSSNYVTFIGGSTPGLANSYANCFFEDKQGTIWIGTYHGGLSAYDPIKKTFRTYAAKEGLAEDNILAILEDDRGFLWLSSENGLIKFDKHRITFKVYNNSDGLPGNVFNNASSLRDSKGQMFFGGYNGLVSFYPDQIRENHFSPRVVFTSLKLFNENVQLDAEDGLLKKAMSLTKEITFSSKQNVFTIEFAALNYVKPKKNRYKYKLEGFDKNWSEGAIPSATYTNLPSGRYTFLVKGSNNDGLWNETPIKIEIRVLPPIWRTWWAYFLYAIAGGVLFYFILRFTRRQQRLESELYFEHLNNERQQELYQMKLDFFTRISHEIRTPLTLIFAPLEKLIKLTKENNMVNYQLYGIKRNTDRLLRLISELLDFRKIETGNAKLQVSENDLVAFCRSIYNSYEGLAEIKNIAYSFSCKEEQIYTWFDISQMEKVFYNILSNAFKYTPDGGKISFSIDKETEGVKVVIADTGIGIPLEVQDKIFTNFYQVNSGSATIEGWGIGLALVKNIVDLHSGEITVSSTPSSSVVNGNTALSVTLLLGKAHFKPDELLAEEMVIQAEASIPEIMVWNENSPLDKIIEEKKYTIQVVEDNDELRGFIVQSLQSTYHVLESLNGLEGWKKAIEHIPDLIVSDVTMPELNGLEFCSRLKAEESTNHIPVIMLTAMASHLHQVDGLEAGADIYITKPFSIQVLELSIRNLLQGRESLKEKYIKQIMLSPRKLESVSPDEKFLNKLMLLIEENMEDSEFNVSSLVENIGMSQTVLYKKIKALTGLSILDFTKSQRLKRAAQLLAEQNLSIAEVAYTVGFNDRKYFSKEFRKQFGVAPSEYNKKINE